MTVQPTHVALWGQLPDGSLTVVADGTASWCIENGLLRVGYSIRYRDTRPVQPVDGAMPTYLDEQGNSQPTGSFWSRKEGRGRALAYLQAGDPRHTWSVPVEHLEISEDAKDVRSRIRSIIWAHWIERMQKKIHATRARRAVAVTKREAMIDFSTSNADIIATLL